MHAVMRGNSSIKLPVYFKPEATRVNQSIQLPAYFKPGAIHTEMRRNQSIQLLA